MISTDVLVKVSLPSLIYPVSLPQGISGQLQSNQSKILVCLSVFPILTKQKQQHLMPCQIALVEKVYKAVALLTILEVM